MAYDTLASPYQPARGLRAKIVRRLTQWRCAQPLAADPGEPLVSFTFDDFPHTAAQNGGDILERFDARGCFYAATGLAGGIGPGGPLFTETDVVDLLGAGHEIGAHTVSHGDLAKTGTARALRDIQLNLEQLKAMGASTVSQFAYPYGETTLGLKRALIGRFTAARGILPGLNGAGSDAMQLRAMEIDSTEDNLQRCSAAIEQALATRSWLIFFTHDVKRTPGNWGTTPDALTRLARQARDGGARLVTPSQAMQQIASRAG